MLPEQLILILTTLCTFTGCLLLVKFLAKSPSLSTSLFPPFLQESLQDLDKSTDIMADNKQLLAFIVGIILALAAYQIFKSNSAYPRSILTQPIPH
jgi:hypothetical protein